MRRAAKGGLEPSIIAACQRLALITLQMYEQQL